MGWEWQHPAPTRALACSQVHTEMRAQRGRQNLGLLPEHPGLLAPSLVPRRGGFLQTQLKSLSFPPMPQGPARQRQRLLAKS